MMAYIRLAVSFCLILVLLEEKRVTCSTVRLVDGIGAHEGRLEIRPWGKKNWNSLCNIRFDYQDATVVCRQLEYGIVSENVYTTPGPTRSGTFGGGYIALKRGGCYGNEPSFTKCRRKNLNCIFTRYCCDRKNEVHVRCIPRPCTPGTFRDGRGGCPYCHPGTFSTSVNQDSCEPCPRGTYQPGAGFGSCRPCDDGWTNLDIGSAQCLHCPKGQIFEGKKRCRKCRLGHFQDEIGQDSCKPCAPGHFADTEGRPWCAACWDGHVQPESGKTGCVVCKAGTHTTAWGQAVCTPCPAGHFSHRSGMGVCWACGNGQSAPVGSTGCNACRPGTYADSWHYAACQPCNVGTFQNLNLQSSCNYCSPGSYQTQKGSTSCFDCPLGHTSGHVRSSIASCVTKDSGVLSFRNDPTFKYDCDSLNPCIVLVTERRFYYPHSTPGKIVHCKKSATDAGVTFYQCEIVNDVG